MEMLNKQNIHSPTANAPHVYQKPAIYAEVNQHQQRHLSVNKQ